MELFNVIITKVDIPTLSRLSRVNSSVKALVDHRFWNTDILDLDDRRQIDAITRPRICAALQKHTESLTLAVSDDPISQRFFRKVINAIRHRPIVSLRLKNAHLKPRSYQRLNDVLSNPSSLWMSSLQDIQLPLQTAEDMGKSFYEPLNGTFYISTKREVQDIATRKRSTRNIEIRAWGSQQIEFPAYRVNGTPFQTFQSLIGNIGNLRQWDTINLTGNQSLTASVDDIMDALDVHYPSLPIRITNLSLAGFSFEDLPLSDFDQLDASSVRHLSIRDCSSLPDLFEHFMGSASALQLESFECCMWNHQEDVDHNNPHNIQAFLLSLSGLKYLAIHVHSVWSLDLRGIISQHPDLEHFEYSTNNTAPSLEFIDAAQSLYGLKRLGFRASAIEELMRYGSLTEETKKQASTLFWRLGNMLNLEELMVIFRPLVTDGRSSSDTGTFPENLKAVADEVYAMLGSSAIKRIKLWMRHSRYRPNREVESGVPAPYVFDYE
ncbi:unnamed protein product [Periconia digitata]|uniref:F-box domain-containing protein n=1 Tax=Periconia digitata TaxID=1303443 RepID=A0A9W4XJA9_9PLEO|nr:unnamed protein product [Periconia digitata]